MNDTMWLFWCLWIIASGSAIACLLIAIHHCNKARQSCQRAIDISAGMLRDIEKMQRLIEEVRRLAR